MWENKSLRQQGIKAKDKAQVQPYESKALDAKKPDTQIMSQNNDGLIAKFRRQEF